MTGARLLVTTALEEAYVPGFEPILLGEWCRLYGRRSEWSERRLVVMPYHWDSAEKRRADYEYLESLYRRALPEIVRALNLAHGESRSDRYWEIIVGAWLMTYITSLYERWESVRLAFERYGTMATVRLLPAAERTAPAGSQEQILLLVDDLYNHGLFLDMIESQRVPVCEYIEVASPPRDQAQSHTGRSLSAPFRVRDVLKRAARRAYRWGARFQNRNSYALVGAWFPRLPSMQLNALLGQLPRPYHEFEEEFAPVEGNGESPAVRQRMGEYLARAGDPASSFETFLFRRIATEIPASCVEHLHGLRARADGLGLRCKVIVSANPHWNNELFKVWAAERVLRGTKLVLCEHGASIPADQSWFHWEESVADVFVPTFLSHHAKHRQMPPPKWIGVKRCLERSPLFATIIPFDAPRYAIRAAAQPHSRHALDGYDACMALYVALPSHIQAAVRVKVPPAYAPSEWELRARFADGMGASALLEEMPLEQAFTTARVLICTYPQSTFAESMLSGIPTILFFDPRIHGVHRVARDLVDHLVRAGICHFTPASAAARLTQIWDDPEAWWNTPTVQHARAEFMRATMNQQSRPVRTWARFLRDISESG